ncbi:hypothetical protein C6497_16160 [Candidatus Poribacteria bacterium]|nr:MAG: hypothetical protein C6497_16160 [Candidatus Poribacteria bacterium]
MKKFSTFWQVVRDFWRTGKTGVALFLISLFSLIYGDIALDFEIAQGWKGHVSVQNVTKDISAFIPVVGAFVAMIIGGIDLMMLLADFIDARRKKRIEEAKVIAKAEGKAEGIAEGIAEGKAEGIAEGIAEGEARAYRKFADWERRRKEAEARGEEFTEPLPTKPQDNSEE